MIFCRIEASDAASHRNLLIAIAHTRNWGEEKALKLIEQGADLAQRTENTDLPIVEMLIAAGADVNKQDPYNYTPL